MSATTFSEQHFTPTPPPGTPALPPRRRGGWRIVRGAWKLLVAIKDLLVLMLMLLFFGLLFAALAKRPTTTIADGALLIELNGSIVEQPAEPAVFAALSGQRVPRQYRLRDLVRAIDAARTDARVKAVVLDLDRYGGGYPAAVAEVADALYRVRRSGKPVLAYATAYTDGSYRLAAAASEVWQNADGGTLLAGPGGTQLYYKGLIDRLGVTTHVYRVGRYKSFVEPYTRADQSDDARQASEQLAGTLLGQWRDGIARMRPRAQVAAFMAQPDRAVVAAGGDVAAANLRAGMVDRLGDRTAFGERVAALAGSVPGKPAGSFRTIRYTNWVAANPVTTAGNGIGVLTVAGDIIDGEGPAGTAAAETITRALFEGLAKGDLKALVVRIDSPGGSALASERIRTAIVRAKSGGLPVVVSMGGAAASGGYWVATAGDTIFAEPNTITGSIGIFAVIPSFEKALAKIGITSDGVRTTPLSGQPDLTGGLSPAFDTVIQASIDNGYRRFLSRVSAARKMPVAKVDTIAQGRVWDGGTARQLGLVDRFGTLDDAIAEAARRAKLDPAAVHPVYLEKKPGWATELAKSLNSEDEGGNADGGDALARIATAQRALLAQALGDVRRLATAGSVQARCLECGGFGGGTNASADVRLIDMVFARLGLGPAAGAGFGA